MMMEVMGLHMPGAAFVNPGTKLRQELTRAAVHRLAAIGWGGNDYRPLGRCVDERAIVNAAVGLLATGGSTNHAIHLPAIARAAGIVIDWEDLDRLSSAVPLIARIYPDGDGDVNGFQAAGGMAFMIRTLLDAGLLHGDILTVAGDSLADYAREPVLDGETLAWDDRAGRAASTPHPAPGRRARSPPTAACGCVHGQSRPRDLQDQRGRCRALDDRGPGAGVRRPGRGARRVQGGRARPRRRRRRPLPGPARQRHARTAQADARARRAAGPRLPGRAGHRRPDVGRERQGPGGDPRHARGAGGGPLGAGARRRHHPRLCASTASSPCIDAPTWARAHAGAAAADHRSARGANCSP